MFKNKLVLIGTIVAIVASLFLIIGIGAGVWWLWDKNLPVSVISVQGKATKKVQYDKVTINMTISLVGSDVNSLNTEVDNKTTKIVDYLKSQGIKENEIQTSKTSYPDYQPIVYATPTSVAPTSNQTRVETNFIVVFNDFKTEATKPNKVIAEATKLGVNRFGAFNYDFQDNKQICADLENKATDDAWNIAQNRIKSLGGGRIVKKTANFLSTCNNFNYPIAYATSAKVDSSVGGSSDTPPAVLGGEQELSSQVELTVEYK